MDTTIAMPCAAIKPELNCPWGHTSLSASLRAALSLTAGCAVPDFENVHGLAWFEPVDRWLGERYRCQLVALHPNTLLRGYHLLLFANDSCEKYQPQPQIQASRLDMMLVFGQEIICNPANANVTRCVLQTKFILVPYLPASHLTALN